MTERVMIVTGALGALGRVMLERAAEAGWTCAGIDAAGSATSLAGAAILAPVDLSSSEAAAAAIERIARDHGRIDALVNVAGGFAWEPIQDGSSERWSDLFAINVLTALNTSRAALPWLEKVPGGGRIVNVGANAAARADSGMGPYAAAKAGVHKLTESLASECRGRVRVNAVLPSILDTAANRRDMPEADFGLWVTPQQLATVILFLASDEASAVTGALGPVTGRL